MFPAEPTNMVDNDLHVIYLALKSIYDATVTPVPAELIGQTIFNVKVFPAVIPVNCTTQLDFTLGDLGIGKYLFIPKSIRLTISTSGVVADRTVSLIKKLSGFPINILNAFTNQETAQPDSQTEDYNFGRGNSNIENVFYSNYFAQTQHMLLIPEGFELHFNNGITLDDFISIDVNNADVGDAYVNAMGLPIVMVGDIIKLQD